MRTTLDLDDALMKAAKRRAVDEQKSLTSVIEEAVRRFLQPGPRLQKPVRIKLLIKKGRLIPGVDLADRDSLYERMEGRG